MKVKVMITDNTIPVDSELERVWAAEMVINADEPVSCDWCARYSKTYFQFDPITECVRCVGEMLEQDRLDDDARWVMTQVLPGSDEEKAWDELMSCV